MLLTAQQVKVDCSSKELSLDKGSFRYVISPDCNQARVSLLLIICREGNLLPSCQLYRLCILQKSCPDLWSLHKEIVLFILPIWLPLVACLASLLSGGGTHLGIQHHCTHDLGIPHCLSQSVQGFLQNFHGQSLLTREYCDQ